VKLAIGLVVVAYFPFAIQHMLGWGLFTLRNNFPLDGSIYIAVYFTWWERLSLATVGIVVGFFVVIALRQIGLAKPRDAAY